MDENIKIIPHCVIVEIKCLPKSTLSDAFLPVASHNESLWMGEFENLEEAAKTVTAVGNIIKSTFGDVKSESN